MELDEEKRSKIFGMIKKEHEEDSKNKESPADSTRGLVKQIHEQAVVEKVQTSEEYQNKFFAAAARTIDNELESLNQEQIKRRQETTYDANAEACQNYGINSDVPLWQIKLMKIGSGFWFVIYWMFASFTIAPLNVFFNGIRPFFKNNFIVFALAVLGYLIVIVGIPLAITLLG